MGTRAELTQLHPIDILVFHVVTKKNATTLRVLFWVAIFKLAPFLVAEFTNPTKVDGSPICRAPARTCSASMAIYSLQAPRPLTGCGRLRNLTCPHAASRAVLAFGQDSISFRESFRAIHAGVKRCGFPTAFVAGFLRAVRHARAGSRDWTNVG